jgi:hypothetical protein
MQAFPYLPDGYGTVRIDQPADVVSVPSSVENAAARGCNMNSA